MSASQSDRNVLFGVLALQMEFITQAGLIAALQAWTLQKSRPLGELLVELGHLSADDRAALEPMVDRHVARHGGSAEQSLAALSSVSDVAAELRELNDADVQKSLRHVAVSEFRQAGVLSGVIGGPVGYDISTQIQPAIPETTQHEDQPVLRFQLLRPHAEGGLGRVWIAKDRELNREVAFKEIKPKRAQDKNSRGRFVREAEITGGLEHPGIVPVYALGHYQDGRPFYAMRFIRGHSLLEAIKKFHHPANGERQPSDGEAASGAIDQQANAGRSPEFGSLAFRKLVQRLIDVCNAIAYAHSRGVLHRDLKPGNIMLGKYGETLVVDWGLAKAKGQAFDLAAGASAGASASASASTIDYEPALSASGSGEVAATQMGSAVGTPAYMSPEQAAGRLDLLSPPADVYSLGATLYHLLSGQPPFVGKSTAEVLRRVQAGDFPRPSDVVRSLRDRTGSRRDPATNAVPKPLEAICLKAMSRRPRDRYVTSQALAEDLERWLADEPVAVYREPLPVRVRRFVRRHQVAVTSLAAAIVVALLGLGALSAVVSGKNDQLADANTRLQNKNSELEQSNQRERDATKLAEQNAVVAREQSQLALQSLQSVIFDIQRKLRNVPGAGDLQRSLLDTALARLQEVSDQFAARGAIDRNTMVALNDLGGVFLRIGTGSASGQREPAGHQGADTLRSPEADTALTAARKVYQQAFDIAQKLAAADPSDAQAQRDLSVSYERFGNVLLQSGQVTEALDSYQKCLEISQKLAAADASDAQDQRDLYVSYERLGTVQLQSGQVTKALGQYQKCLEISQKLAAADPSDARALRDLSISYEKLGDVLLRSGQVTEALEQYQKGLAIRQKLAAADPSDAQAQRDLSVSYNNLGDVLLQSGQVTEALDSYQKFMEISQKLAAADPSDAQAQRDLSVSYNKLGDVLLQSGQVTEALGQYQKGVEIRQKLAEADPSDAQAQRDVSVSYNKLGDVLLQSGQVTEALGQYQTGLEMRQKLAAADPNDAQAQRDLSISYERLGDVQRQSGQVTEALGQFQKSLDIKQKLAAADPSDAQARRDLSISYNRLGDVLLQSGQVTEALGQYQKGLEISQKLAAAGPNNAQAQFDLYVSHHKIAAVQQKQKQYEQAIESYGRGMNVLQALKERKRLAPANEKWIGIVEQAMQQCKLAPAAFGNWKMLLEQPAELLPVLLEMRGMQFVHEGRARDAVQAVAKLRELGMATADQLYSAACVYSLCAAGIKAEKDEFTAEQAAARKKHIADALATLREAIAAGWKGGFAYMQKDRDLTVLRGLPEFESLFPKKPEK